MFRQFDYVRPESLSEAVEILASNPNAQPLAGGTDLLLELRERTTADRLLVDIKHCSALAGIERRGEHFFIGALTTIQELAESEELRSHYRALWDAAKVFGCYEIRNRATIGGNIVHASPGAESGTPLFAFDARVELAGPGGTRSLPVGEFWKDAGRVSLEPGEVLKGILLPVFEVPVESRYRRISRTKGMDLAALGVSVVVLSPHDPPEREIRVAMAAVERTPYRNREVEASLSHRLLDAAVLDSAKKLMAESIHPRESSLRAKPPYKRAMVGSLTERIIDELSLLGA